MTDYIYNSKGDAVGLLDCEFIYSMTGEPVGYLDDTQVYRISGLYIGELLEDMVVDMKLIIPNIGKIGSPENIGRLTNPGNRGSVHLGYPEIFYRLLEK